MRYPESLLESLRPMGIAIRLEILFKRSRS